MSKLFIFTMLKEELLKRINMKKYIIITTILLLAAACSAPTTIINNPLAQNEQPAFDGRLQIDSPKEGDVIDSAFTITGKAQDWFEGTIAIEIYDGMGNNIYKSSFIVPDNYGHPAAFVQGIHLSESILPASQRGRIEFIDYSAKDGSVVYRRVVNIKFKNYVAENSLQLPIKYDNKQYGFIFSLPESWKGYAIITQTSGGWSWEASKDLDDSTIIAKGPAIIIRSPLWTAAKPYQDIPIEVFTLQQWQDIQSGKILYRTAAPVGPAELGRNSKYVFALPPRYSFAEPDGVREVDDIIQKHPLAAY